MGELTVNPSFIFVAVLTLAGILVKGGMWIGSVNADRKSFRKSLGDLAHEIREDIKKILSRLPPAPISAGSPLRLTDFGRQIADQIKAEEWSRRLCASGALQKAVEEKSPYEIQEFCLNYAQSELDYDDLQLDLLRRCAFDSGSDVEAVKRVLGFVLRDRLLPPELIA